VTLALQADSVPPAGWQQQRSTFCTSLSGRSR
jgi:hypothetical protein